MSTRQIIADLLQKLPENATLHDVDREIEFVAAVRQGLEALDCGEGIPPPTTPLKNLRDSH